MKEDAIAALVQVRNELRAAEETQPEDVRKRLTAGHA